MSDNNKTSEAKKPKEDNRTKLERLLDIKRRLELALAREKQSNWAKDAKRTRTLKRRLVGRSWV